MIDHHGIFISVHITYYFPVIYLFEQSELFSMNVSSILMDDIQYGRMIEDLEQRKLNEACGILIGSIREQIAEVSDIVPMANLLDSPRKFKIAPEELYKVWRDAEDSGKEVLGAYHTHPESDSYPSQLDIENMQYSTFIWVIIGRDKQVRAYTYN
ncbi:MAG: M67 family metallopeptidase, partial [Caulobacteraceae bacterium]